ncbi:MAG: acyl-CoA/acyl-ACP dehydrogenase [Candidatus Bathyarchaeota archaeon]|nr:acyl-CoA/acyl-ACP dehydrogenase [Candidatus Bathyarchaeota archaeon]
MVLETNVLLTNEEAKLRDEIKEFVKSIAPDYLRAMEAEEIDYPEEALKEMARRKILGLRFPKKYGGRELNWVSDCVAVEEISVLGQGMGCVYSMPIIVGESLIAFGTEEQKKKYLSPILTGEIISAEGLTEPRGGSDFFGTITTAEKRNGLYVLNGEKRFIAGAVAADLFLLYARTDPKAPGHQALSAFLVEKDMGVEIAERYGLMGFHGMGTARIVLKDVAVPEENLLLGENKGALIFNRMMVPERLTSAAGSLGIRATIETAVRYSDKRKAFGAKIRRFEGVSFKIADCMTKLDAARGLVYIAAKQADLDPDSSQTRRLVSEAKLFATQAAWEIVNDAMQILGGIGYTYVYPVEKALRDTRLGLIWTGSNEVMKMLVQHEAYRRLLTGEDKDRDLELDAIEAHKIAEKVFE